MISGFYKSALIRSGGLQILVVNFNFIFLYQFGFDIVTLIFKVYFSVCFIWLYQPNTKIVTSVFYFF